MANVIKMLLPLRVYANNKHFPKNSSFFHNFIKPSELRLCQNLRNRTANYVLCVLNQKQISTLTLYCGLHFQFRRAHFITREIFIYYTTRGLKILDYTRRVVRKHHEIVDRVVFPAIRRVIENFPSSSCIRVDYIMNKINK
jgi:hypothetical protein